MKYTKAVECDFCGRIEVSVNRKSFKTWFKFIEWLQIIQGNGLTKEFCSKECYDNYKSDISTENKS